MRITPVLALLAGSLVPAAVTSTPAQAAEFRTCHGQGYDTKVTSKAVIDTLTGQQIGTIAVLRKGNSKAMCAVVVKAKYLRGASGEIIIEYRNRTNEAAYQGKRNYEARYFSPTLRFTGAKGGNNSVLATMSQGGAYGEGQVRF